MPTARPIPACCARMSPWKSCRSIGCATAFSCTTRRRRLFDPKWGTVDPGVVADLTRRGLFGRGLTGGIGTRLNPSQQTIRTYISSRTFFGLPAQTNVYLSTEDEKTASAGVVLNSRTNSITFDQRVRYRRLLQVGYGYSFEKRKFDFLLQVPTLPAPIPIEGRANIGRLLGSVAIDKRDDVINTRQGPFHSSSVEWGPTELGSTRPFRKYLGQHVLLRAVEESDLRQRGTPGSRWRTRPRSDHDRTPARRRRQHRPWLRGRHALVARRRREYRRLDQHRRAQPGDPVPPQRPAPGRRRSGTTPTSTARRATSPACGCATASAQGFGCCCPSSSCAWTTATRSTRTSSTTRAGGTSR